MPASDPSATREAAERAVQLDPRCAGCQAVLGFTLFSRFWEWSKASEHLQEALKLSPASSGLRGYMAMYLSSQARLEEALEHANEAVRLDPYFATGHHIRAMVLFFTRRYPESVQAAGRALSFNAENAGALDARAMALLGAGREKEALDDWLAIAWKEGAVEMEAIYKSQGIRGAFGRLLDETSMGRARLTNSYRRARWRMHLGDIPGALEELEAALEFRHFNLMYIRADPAFETLRAEPRFQRIVEKMGLSQTLARR